MIILHDPQCADFGSETRPEQPARVRRATEFLRAAHPGWEWRLPRMADESVLALAHAPELLQQLQNPEGDFDEDTPYVPDIYAHARRSVGAALEAVDLARAGQKVFSLMRPPGHHATYREAMGFCYLNQVAIAGLVARQQGVARVAIWDFDAHHGNGTEDILKGREGFAVCSVHQFPGYPGTGTQDTIGCRNWPIAPHATREVQMQALRQAWDHLLAFQPELMLISAGFDAYAHDPVATLSLEMSDFGELGKWVREAALPTAAVLEGGYSPDLPQLMDAFLSAWEG
ncbi:MAG TPA: histone deacetylase [Opitutaceae bacterium]|jgi:acetoin utilization deacetylase AcuC-like enzyme|nr:histone deacetylase [Opitutaceae bacterium]HOG92475.1 histone deacetylase [Opitutaceae bacterium]HOR24158.1 histone deacetylase [Opitutaceae bacterium]HPK48477.1 histone deacetylase [Opitutaceae bacterium]